MRGSVHAIVVVKESILSTKEFVFGILILYNLYHLAMKGNNIYG